MVPGDGSDRCNDEDAQDRNCEGGRLRVPSTRSYRSGTARTAFIFRVNSAGSMGPMLGNGCGLPALISGDLGGRRAGMMDGPTCAPGNRIQDGLR